MRLSLMAILKSTIVIASLFATTSLHTTTRNRNSGGDADSGGPNRVRNTATQPPVGTAIRKNTEAVFHNRPVYQITFGPHSERLSSNNRRVMRNEDPENRPYRGGWHRNHTDIKDHGMESNHVPPKQVMSKLDPPWEYSNGTRWSHSNGSAMELDYEDHRSVSTTGSAANKPHLDKLEAILSDTSRPRDDRMADALLAELDDVRTKLGYHNIQEQNQPNPDANPHERPVKNITRYDEAFKQMVRTCYPELVNHPTLTDALGEL